MRVLSLIVIAAIGAGCGEKPEMTTGASAGSTSSGSTTEGASAGTTSAGTAGTATTDEPTGSGSATGTGGATEATSTTTGATTTTGTTGATGTTGGGSACGETCGANQWCDSPLNQCDLDPFAGECKPKPQACDDIFLPVCGCDGKVYGNECEAQAAGVDVAEAVDCEPPEGRFQCGYIFCEPTSQFCVVSVSDVSGLPDTYSCAPLPDGCQPASCECLKDTACGFNCEPATDGGFKTICPGG